MKNLINFFFSFDKLMKHKLVPLFFWSALIYGAIWFAREILGWTSLTEWIAKLTYFLEISALAIMGFVGLRLVCELAIAIFRISDNLSPDGGASDLADIDPLEETRRAAEEAAKRAREVTEKAVDKTKEVASNIKESAEKKFDKTSEPADSSADQVFDKPKSSDSKSSDTKMSSAKSSSSKSSASKKSTSKTSTTKKSTSTKKPSTPKKDEE